MKEIRQECLLPLLKVGVLDFKKQSVWYAPWVATKPSSLGSHVITTSEEQSCNKNGKKQKKTSKDSTAWLPCLGPGNVPDKSNTGVTRSPTRTNNTWTKPATGSRSSLAPRLLARTGTVWGSGDVIRRLFRLVSHM